MVHSACLIYVSTLWLVLRNHPLVNLSCSRTTFMAFWDYLCVCIKLLSQNMSKCLRSVVEGLCNLVGLLEARKNLFLWIILSLPPHTRANPTVSSRDWLRSKSQKLISLTFTSFPSLRALNRLYRQRLINFWDFCFLIYFFSCFVK